MIMTMTMMMIMMMIMMLTSGYWTLCPLLTHSLFSVSTATSPGLPASTLRNLVSGPDIVLSYRI